MLDQDMAEKLEWTPVPPQRLGRYRLSQPVTSSKINCMYMAPDLGILQWPHQEVGGGTGGTEGMDSVYWCTSLRGSLLPRTVYFSGKLVTASNVSLSPMCCFRIFWNARRPSWKHPV